MNKTSVIIYTDGACRGNPGPGGWGVVLLAGKVEKRLSGFEPYTTNNRMELAAAIEALKALKFPCQVVLTTDSSYVKDGITQWISGWRKRRWKTKDKQPVKNIDLWLALDEQVTRHMVKWEWVKGHSGNKYNEVADQLATGVIDEAMANLFKRGGPEKAGELALF